MRRFPDALLPLVESAGTFADEPSARAQPLGAHERRWLRPFGDVSLPGWPRPAARGERCGPDDRQLIDVVPQAGGAVADRSMLARPPEAVRPSTWSRCT